MGTTVSEKFRNIINICEMAKLVSHASKLKCDDVRLEGLATSYRVCLECDFYLKEDIFQVVMHCPSTEVIRRIVIPHPILRVIL